MILFVLGLALISFVHAEQCPKYVRCDYGGWIDAERDCHTIEQRVLLHMTPFESDFYYASVFPSRSIQKGSICIITH